MKRLKMDIYTEKLNTCVNSVRKAVNEGALLTDMELLDYYFKSSMIGNLLNNYKKDVYAIAKFYHESLMKLHILRQTGFTNKQVRVMFREMCFSAFVHRLAPSCAVNTYDVNGTLFAEFIVRGKPEYTFKINNMRSFTKAVLAIASYLASCKVEDKEFKEYVETYLINVFNEICLVKDPTVYVYEGKSKALRSYMVKTEKEDENIIRFRVG